MFTKQKLLCDGAFGTYYAMKYDTKDLPELANLEYPERVLEIHQEYLEAGANMIRTNTFACNSHFFKNTNERNACIKAGFSLAKEAASRYQGLSNGQLPVYVAADIGQIPYEQVSLQKDIRQEYVDLCELFLQEGANLFVFETFHQLEDIIPAIQYLGEKATIIVQFAVNQFGYSSAGFSAKRLMEEASQYEQIDVCGFNCGLGPGHMKQLLDKVQGATDKPLSVLPNAGYPQIVKNRMIFSNDNISYFVDKMKDMEAAGAALLGGCCGTTPEYIRAMKQELSLDAPPAFVKKEQKLEISKEPKQFAFYQKKADTKEKLIAVELAPPLGCDDEKLLDAAHFLERMGVDVLTFPDSPSGRTRADSILMAQKVLKETNLMVMPHICCRDKNAIAMRSQVLGAYLNHIYNFLVITGDPIPTMARSAIKSVFNFDAVGLMNIIGDMNAEHFSEGPVCYGGAINQGRRNLEVEIGRVKKKMAAGASFFLSQPVSTRESAMRLKEIKEETSARILCGIMPFVSLKNAMFMKNEMTGIDVNEEVLSRYRGDMTREEGEAAGIMLAKDMIALTENFVDGYYFSFPFNRVHMLEAILGDI